MHYFNSHWRTVCDKNWTDNMNNSNVLCQQLGLGHAEDHHLESRSEEDTHFLHTDIDCSGTENKLRLCKHRFIPDDSCNGESVPWVKCTGEYIQYSRHKRVHACCVHWKGFMTNEPWCEGTGLQWYRAIRITVFILPVFYYIDSPFDCVCAMLAMYIYLHLQMLSLCHFHLSWYRVCFQSHHGICHRLA